jgi:uncharacterized repeat protein (TIGR01451 family)
MTKQTVMPDHPSASWRLKAALAILLVVALLLIAHLISRARPAVVSLEATKTDSLLVDANGDGVPNTGDTLLYQVVITNTGDDPATGGLFTDNPDVDAPLVVGSVQTSQGTIIRGNTLGDTDVQVDTGDIPAFSTMTISFQAEITYTIATEVSNQGVLNTNEVTTTYTNDPDTPADDDPTITPVIYPTILIDKILVAADLDDMHPNFVTFTITVSNLDLTTAIDVLPLYDEYDPYYLSFLDATTYPDEDADDGRLTWYDLTGPFPNGFGSNLAGGAAFYIDTVFSVTHDITVTVNLAQATGARDVFGAPLGSMYTEAIVINVPTAAEVLFFRADEINGRKVQLEWATATEVDNVGFKLYRTFDSMHGQAEQVAYIPSQAHGGGAIYTHVDTVPQPGSWWYWLVDVDTSGQETLQGAVKVTVDRHFPLLYLPLILYETYLP